MAEKENKLLRWIEDNNISETDAKKFLKAMRDTKSREYNAVNHDFSGPHIRIGVLGDTHFGNKWTDKAFLRDVMKRFKTDGVEEILHVGDLTDGPWQRHRNVIEQYAHGFSAQVNDFVEDFPDVNIPVYVIDGNHDGWYRKGEGGVVGEEIALRRNDINYLGNDEAIIKFGKLEIMLSHPDDGTSYAYSYKGQKFIEAMVKMGERIPEVILQGHYHKTFYMNAAGTNYFCTGTTCRQTPWMRGKKIAADMGAFELDIYRNSRGELVKLTSTLLAHHGEKHKRAIK